MLVIYVKHFPISVSFIGETILHRIGDAALFYANALWVLPKYLNVKKLLILIPVFSLLVICYVAYSYFLEFYLFKYLGFELPNDIPNFEYVISLNILTGSNFIIFSIGYYFSQRVIQQQKEIAQRDISIAKKDTEIAIQKAVVAEQKVVLIKKEIELAEEREKNAILAKEKAQAEMAFLRAQINPHFLYNTLNMIYSKVITSTKEIAAELILDFSRMMQYATGAKMQEDTVDLDGEVGFVRDYIKMFKARNQQNAHVDFDDEGYFGSHRVVPMVLITMVENAFKHGLTDDPNNPVIIRASMVDDFFVFMVRNPKNPYPHDVAGKGNTGVGIVNIIKRLNAVYKKGGFTLESEDLKDDYIVTFTVNYKLL